MELSLFYGNEDAYWWILCIERYSKETRISELAKMMVVALTMQGRSLQWRTFTTALLWRLNSKWQHLLQVLDEETKKDWGILEVC